MYSKKEIELVIVESITKITGIKNLNNSICLIDKNVDILPVDFLYIFDEIEKSLNVPINSLLQNNSAELFIMKNLVDKVYELYKNSVDN